MRTANIHAWFLGGLICLSGCSGVRNAFVGNAAHRPARPAGALDMPATAESPFESESPTERIPSKRAASATEVARTSNDAERASERSPTLPDAKNATPQKLVITPVGHEETESRSEKQRNDYHRRSHLRNPPR